VRPSRPSRAGGAKPQIVDFKGDRMYTESQKKRLCALASYGQANPRCPQPSKAGFTLRIGLHGGSRSLGPAQPDQNVAIVKGTEVSCRLR